MWLFCARVALAAEPGALDPALPDLGPALTWAEVGLDPGGAERAARGPDLLAAGPSGRWAVYSPVDRHVVGAGIDLALPPVDGLAFAPDGDLLVLIGRDVTRWDGATRVAGATLPALAPAGATLVVTGDRADVVDVFGNLHPVASLTTGALAAPSGPPLFPAEHVVKLRDGRVTVDARAVPTPADTLGARVIGDWLVVEAGERGAVRAREAVSLTTGKRVPLPLRSAAPYRASSDVAVSPEGDLTWLDPRADGLYVHREAP